MAHISPNTPLHQLTKTKPERLRALERELGLKTWGDLIAHLPHRYIDRSSFTKISDIGQNSSTDEQKDIQVVGSIVRMQEVGVRPRRLEAYIDDGTGSAKLVWFKGAQWIKKMITTGEKYVVFGRPNFFHGQTNFAHPEVERLSLFRTKQKSAMLGVYPSTELLTKMGLDGKKIGTFIQNLLFRHKPAFVETLPISLLQKNDLLPLQDAIYQVHAPTDKEILQRAWHRLKYEELFYMQLRLLLRKKRNNEHIAGFVFGNVGHYFHTFYEKHLSFPLTSAQKRVIREIRYDMQSGRHMNRLLQGDVGSGKTIVAFMCMLLAIDNGYQSTLIAPTEVLAKQHFHSLREWAEAIGIHIALLTGSTKAKRRTEIHAGLQGGITHIIIGTHAILEETVRFARLGLAIVDEQHRFGVAQRSRLWKKSQTPPHMLVMTATPIPRTLAMSLYGDLDVSVIDELPKGRKPIKTMHMYEENRKRVYDTIHRELKKGRQAYIIYPLIEESETLDFENIEKGYEVVQQYFTDYTIATVHGRLPVEEKDEQMKRFEEGKAHIMVATTVIEVGVNIPNASIILIESAQRFGLSQLHQLRGRVGRSDHQSYCLLSTPYQLSADGRVRMQTMVETTDGFKIADVDLKLRGPGEIEGTQQSGVINLKAADLRTDYAVMSIARNDAQEILDLDPKFEQETHLPIRHTLNSKHEGKFTWSMIS